MRAHPAGQMDARIAPEALADALRDASDDERDAATADACASAAGGALALAVALEGPLTSGDPRTRRRATALLSRVASLIRARASADEVRALCRFFAARLGDHASAGWAARGVTALLARAEAAEAAATARALFGEADVQALRQSDREACFELAIAMLGSERVGGGAVRGVGDGDAREAVARVVSAFDGEKDPRCVLGLCEAWTLMPRAFELAGEEYKAAYEENAEELYDVAASYFPVSFKPPRGDSVKISRRQLAEAVERAMTASPSFAPWAVPHALESLNPELGPGKMADAARAVRAMGEKWGARVMEEHLGGIWRAMRAALSHPNATKVEDDDDPRATTPMAVMTTMFASDFGGGALARAALTDQYVRDAEVALERLATAEHSKGSCASMEVDSGEGCCGGGCGGGGGGAADDAARGRAVAASASRVLGAVAAATPALAREVIQESMKTLLDAARIPSNVGARMSAAAYASLILATPAIGGALDCCERNAEKAARASVLGDESERLVHLFSAAAVGEIDAPSVNESVVLGLAGLHMLCKFPPGFGLATDASRAAAASGLFRALTRDHKNESDEDLDARVERAIDALVASVSHGDAALIAAVSSGVVARFAETISTVHDLRQAEAERAIRALVALASANETIRNDVARLFCEQLRFFIENGNNEGAADLADAICREGDGVLTHFVTNDEAKSACARLVDHCLKVDASIAHDFTARSVANAMANCDSETQAGFIQRAFDVVENNPTISCAVICGLREGAEFDVAKMQSALADLARLATTGAVDPSTQKFIAAAVGSVVRKFPTVAFTSPSNDLTNDAVVYILGSCVRARAMRRDGSSEFQQLISALIHALDDASRPQFARGAALALGMAVGFDAANVDIGLGMRACTHATEMFLANQRVFTMTVPTLVAGARNAVGSVRLARSYAAVKLAAGVPVSVALSAQFDLFPLLPDVLTEISTGKSLGVDTEATRTALNLIGARLAEPSLGDASGGAAVERHAASLIDALCDIALAQSTMSMDIRERALDALVAASTLKFSATFPRRERALETAAAACDDPKRPVRRAAARARQAWITIATR